MNRTGGAVINQIKLQEVEPLLFNRVFILGGRGLSEDDWRENFEQFGDITKITVMTDKATGNQKGLCYIHYEKTSEAAAAVETMNGQIIGNQHKPLKVLFAQGKKNALDIDCDEDHMLERLFIKIPKKMTHDEVEEYFSQYGDLQFVRILKDKATGQSRGYAFIKFTNMSSAATALEESDSSYRPRWADVRRKEQDAEEDQGGMMSGNRGMDRGMDMGMGMSSGYGFNDNIGGRYGSSSNLGMGAYGMDNMGMMGESMRGGMMAESMRGGMMGESMRGGMADSLRGNMRGSMGEGMREGMRDRGMAPARRSDPMSLVESNADSEVGPDNLEAVMPVGMTKEQVMKLFDIAPGLEACSFDAALGVAKVRYSSPKYASYAKDKIDGLNYAGQTVNVRYGRLAGSESLKRTAEDLQRTMMQLQQQGSADPMQLQYIMNSIQKVTETIHHQGAGSNYNELGDEMLPWCSVPLPIRKPKALPQKPIEARLFIVSVPEAFGNDQLENVLCRFGDLISVRFQDGKRFGFAKFANKESAENAKTTLHGAYINNNKLKVEYASDPSNREQENGDGPGDRKRKKQW